MSNICGIYSLRNTVTGKRYIGQSTMVLRRRYMHFWLLREGKHVNPHLQRASTNDGVQNIEFEILEETTEEMLDERERAWIERYRTRDPQHGYNLKPGGHGIHHHSDETRSKIGTAQIGRRHSAETRRKISLARTGKPGHRHSEETRRKISEANKGMKHKPFSEETVARMALRMKGNTHMLGRKHTAESKRKMSLCRTGVKHSEETKRRMSVTKRHNDSHRAAIF